MISIEEAQGLLKDGVAPLGTETVPLAEALGRVLAENPTARIAHPAHTVSAMDGYAVRSEDLAALPANLSVIGESAAGHPLDKEINTGQAARIFTGAVVPAGADTVVLQEDCDTEGNTVTVKEAEPGRHIRPKAQDFALGDTVLSHPLRLGPRHIGLLAAADHPQVQVYRRPRVAILSTGDEIVLPGEPRGPHQIVSANGPGLVALVSRHGGIPVHLGVIGDDRAALTAMAKAAEDCDILVTSGGVSVGDHDLVRKALGDAGLNVTFHRIAMRPGKPLMFGQLGGTPVLGLPGNPVSAMICALLFLLPAIDRLQGLPGSGPKLTSAVLAENLPENGKRQDYQRATLSRSEEGHLTVAPFGMQDSSMIGALAKADALIVRRPFAPVAQKGEAVPVIPLDGLL